jgi:hypothetical protein
MRLQREEEAKKLLEEQNKLKAQMERIQRQEAELKINSPLKDDKKKKSIEGMVTVAPLRLI